MPITKITPRSTPLVDALIAYTEATQKLKAIKDHITTKWHECKKETVYQQLVNSLLYESMNSYYYHLKGNKKAMAEFQEISVEEQEEYVQHYLRQSKFI
jgi:hypothetical protein